jgi:hypothetical protein
MKRWFRPVAYSIILLLLALAVLGRPSPPPAAAIVLPTHVDHRVNTTTRPASKPVSRLHERSGRAWATNLFHAATEQSLPDPVAPVAEASTAAPPADLKILGWMLADATPTVFVAYGKENYTLTPTQSVQDVYRFDKLGGGQAVFTYLPTGETRQYAVSDPALSE